MNGFHFITLKAAPHTEVRIVERTHGEEPVPNVLLACVTADGELQVMLPAGYWVVLASGHASYPLQLAAEGGERTITLAPHS